MSTLYMCWNKDANPYFAHPHSLLLANEWSYFWGKVELFLVLTLNVAKPSYLQTISHLVCRYKLCIMFVLFDFLSKNESFVIFILMKKVVVCLLAIFIQYSERKCYIFYSLSSSYLLNEGKGNKVNGERQGGKGCTRRGKGWVVKAI